MITNNINSTIATQTDAASVSVSGVAKQSGSAPQATEEQAKVPTTQDTASQTQEQLEIAADALDAAVSHINDYVQNMERSLSFTVDEASGRTVVTVMDAESSEIIRQFPSEETLKLAAVIEELQDKKEGILLQEKA